MSLIIKNGNIFYQNKGFISADLCIHNGKIVSVQQHLTMDEPDASIIDADGQYIIPGLIDTHLHGCNGYDFSDGTIESIHEMCKYELSAGITSICPATMTLPEDELVKISNAAVSYYTNIPRIQNQTKYQTKHHFQQQSSTQNNRLKDSCTPITEMHHLADFLGFYMEGPFFSREKAGAQRRDCLQTPNIQLFEKMMLLSQGLIKIWAFAPELENAISFAEQIQTFEYNTPLNTINKLNNSAIYSSYSTLPEHFSKPILSIGHTTTDKATAKTAFKTGARRITHLYNGMLNPYEVIEAALPYPDCYAELICDGVHNSEERIKYAFEHFGDDRIILISDSMRATGLGDGTYSLGGQEVFVHGKEALLREGNKAGSVSSLYDCFRTAVNMGIPLSSAIKACTCNPAKSLGLADKIGNISEGYQADLLILDSSLDICHILKSGNVIK